ncbi:MAG TPA: DNA topoisomerase IB [Pseudolabrys sp.]|nr:DNA topoisomerase IB [Pseudolabrys sp.]
MANHQLQPVPRAVSTLLRTLDLHIVRPEDLSIRRRRNGHGFVYSRLNGQILRDKATIRRLKRLAVPPAYQDVFLSADPRAHLQAIGRDSAGRTQYRYHPDWDQVREYRKARRLQRLAHLLPKIRSRITRLLRSRDLSREFALAAVIELVACTAMRPGSESYARDHGTRGATTLLKSDVTIRGDTVTLHFRGKRGQIVDKQVNSRRLARVLRRLAALPGRRLFQYPSVDGNGVCLVRREDVNALLRSVTGKPITLKDFRTMIACSHALSELASVEPKKSERGRRRQVLKTLRSVAQELANTPAVCRKSYVHAAVVEAFESGALRRMAEKSGPPHSPAGSERMLAQVLERITG